MPLGICGVWILSPFQHKVAFLKAKWITKQWRNDRYMKITELCVDSHQDLKIAVPNMG